VGANGVDLPFHRRENVIEGGIGRHSRLRFRLSSTLVGGHRSSKVRPLANAPAHVARLLTTRWAVGAVAVILDEEVNPPEVLLVQHSYRTKGAWGLPAGSLESGLRNPREASTEEPGPYRLDFYYRCLPKQGFSSLREGLSRGSIKPRSPEVRQISLVPISRLKGRWPRGLARGRAPGPPWRRRSRPRRSAGRRRCPFP
jgi:hypothetical protein